MSVVELVKASCYSQMTGIAQRIEADLIAECPKRSGEAAGSIGTTQIGEFTYRIGGENEHLFFADQGNNQRYSYFGGKANRYAPNHQGNGSKMLRFTDGSIHTYASTYEGSHFVKKVADKYR